MSHGQLMLHGKWDAVSMSSPQLPHYKMDRPAYSTPPPVENTPANNECRSVEMRGAKVASFRLGNEEYICLPQAFDLFLKHLVGGLHTVYTKLKRLSISPVVCNVEQVRILRGRGAIQPGVNRCKLITRKDFEVLYQDCTTASRPGRPPKRYPMLPPTTDLPHHTGPLARPNQHMNMNHADIPLYKRMRLDQEQLNERRASGSPKDDFKDQAANISNEAHSSTSANLAYLQALRQQYQQAAATGLHNGLDQQQINPALAPLMMMSHPIFSSALPTQTSMAVLNHINQIAQSHAANGAMSAAAACAAQMAANGFSQPQHNLHHSTQSNDDPSLNSSRDRDSEDCDNRGSPRNHLQPLTTGAGIEPGSPDQRHGHEVVADNDDDDDNDDVADPPKFAAESSPASRDGGASDMSRDRIRSVEEEARDETCESPPNTVQNAANGEQELPPDYPNVCADEDDPQRSANHDDALRHFAVKHPTVAYKRYQHPNRTSEHHLQQQNGLLAPAGPNFGFLTGPGSSSSMHGLLTNIQNLLKVAAQNASLQEKHLEMEIAELKMKLNGERQLRESAEKLLSECRLEKEETDEKLAKEKHEKQLLDAQMKSMRHMFTFPSHNNNPPPSVTLDEAEPTTRQQSSPCSASSGGGASESGGCNSPRGEPPQRIDSPYTSQQRRAGDSSPPPHPAIAASGFPSGGNTSFNAMLAARLAAAVNTASQEAARHGGARCSPPSSTHSQPNSHIVSPVAANINMNSNGNSNKNGDKYPLYASPVRAEHLQSDKGIVEMDVDVARIAGAECLQSNRLNDARLYFKNTLMFQSTASQ